MRTQYLDNGRTVSFRLSTDTWAEICALMRDRGEKASVVLRSLLADGLAAQKEGHPPPDRRGPHEG